jgi:hypothetical protein
VDPKKNNPTKMEGPGGGEAQGVTDPPLPHPPPKKKVQNIPIFLVAGLHNSTLVENFVNLFNVILKVIT